MEMEAKRVGDSSFTMSQIMGPQDANLAGNVHGGVIMRLIDVAGAVAAVRHSRSNVVTASIERLDFHQPIFIGNLVTFKSSLNLVGRTSMEIGVLVESESLRTGEVRKAASAYLTYVALGKDRRPVQVPPLILETEEEIRRNCMARLRREERGQSKSKAEASC